MTASTEDFEDFEREEEANDPELWRDFLHTYAMKVSRNSWKYYKWLHYLCPLLEEFAYKPRGRLILNVPPRHGKSHTSSMWLPAWYLNRLPEHKVMLTSYEADYAATWGGKVRDIALAEPELSGIHFPPRSRPAMGEWSTVEGGGMFTAGAGGPITGRGAHHIIIADPHKNYEEACSETMLVKLQNWYESTLYTRQEPNASLIIIQTRWTENDLTGWLLEEKASENWTHVSIPALCVDPETDPIHRQLGEALVPERYDTQALHDIQTNMDASIFAGLYQQDPQPPGGAIWERQWFTESHWTSPLDLPYRWDEIALSVDAAFKDKTTSSFVVLQVWGRLRDHYYLLDQRREHLNFVRTCDVIIDTIRDRNWYGITTINIEDKANGIPIIEVLKAMLELQRLEINAITPRGSKEARGRAASPAIRQGRVHIPVPSVRHPWVKEYLREVCLFPNAKHDDQFDCTSQMVNKWQIEHPMSGVGVFKSQTRNLVKAYQKFEQIQRMRALTGGGWYGR